MSPRSQHPITSDEEAFEIETQLLVVRSQVSPEIELLLQRLETYDALLRAWQEEREKGTV